MAVKGVLLAAGRGIRMGGITHKSLGAVGEHGPLLHYPLAALHEAGVEDLIVITGHRPQDIQEFVTKDWQGNDATFIRNARYASWGNFHSLRVAIDQTPGADLLVLNADVVVHPDVLARVQTTGGDLVLAVERRYGLDEEDMKVELSGDRVQDIGKDIPSRSSHGEFCGVSLLRRDAAGAYADFATRAEWTSNVHVYYEDIYRQMLDHVVARAAVVREGQYAEVDSPGDLSAAERVIARHSNAWRSPQGSGDPGR
jgi:choline kinase